MTKLPKLYKEKNGKILWWEIETTKNKLNGAPMYVVSHGYVGGSTQVTSTDVHNGKNKGHANETTPEQQCELEAKSEWTKHKERKGYVEDLKVDRGFRPVSPMLAHSTKEYPHKVVLPCYVQKKYDGIRCITHIDKDGNPRFYSRRATEWTTLGHIATYLKSLQGLGIRDIILDGELYKHGLNLQDISSGVKRDDTNDLSGDMEYIVYDAALNGTYENRLRVLSSLLKPEWNSKAIVKLATTYIANNQAQIDEYHDNFVKDGYEGAILRNPVGLYVQDKRSFDLLKYKRFQDDEFEIVGAKENVKGKMAGTCVFQLKTKAGNIFESMPEGSTEIRRKYWQDWCSGKIKPGMMATVEYMRYTATEKPVPFHTTLKMIRNYE
jgi:DNA ligase 1